MRIFVSYASEEKAIAESIAFTLRAHGHHVYLDKDDLPPGRNYDEQIRGAIDRSDLLIFLITPESVTPGRYTLTELEFARQKWRSPNKRVFPVIARATDFSRVPAFLKGVTILEPQGNIAAEVVALVQKYYGRPRAIVAIPSMAGLAVLSTVLGLVAMGVCGAVVAALALADILPESWLESLFKMYRSTTEAEQQVLVHPAYWDASRYLIQLDWGSKFGWVLDALLGMGLGYGVWRWGGRRRRTTLAMMLFAVAGGLVSTSAVESCNWEWFDIKVRAPTSSKGLALGLEGFFGSIHFQLAAGLIETVFILAGASLMAPLLWRLETWLVALLATAAVVIAAGATFWLASGGFVAGESGRLAQWWLSIFLVPVSQGAALGYGLSRETP